MTPDTAGAASAVELATECLGRIADLDGRLHSFVSLDAASVLAEARQRDAQPRSGRLHGLPIAVKDIFDVAGMPTRANSRTTSARAAVADANAVGQLRAHGAVVLGKVQTFELAIGLPSGDDLFPAAVNPLDPSRQPGGSSSGAAVAIAARFCHGALGSDTGGSIRGPAAYCGVVGLKPTYGVISTKGMLPLAPSLDHAGLLARDVEDLARLWVPWAMQRRPPNAGVVRVGVPYDLMSEACVAEGVAARFEDAVIAMRSLGWHVAAVRVPEAARVIPAYRAIIGRESFGQHRAVVTGRSEDLAPRTLERLTEGSSVTDARYRTALSDRDRIRDEYAALMETVDIVATPTTTQVAPLVTSVGLTGPSPFCVAFNLTGSPSLSMPCGRDPTGMSVGLLLSAAFGQDDSLIGAAAELERVLDQRPH